MYIYYIYFSSLQTTNNKNATINHILMQLLYTFYWNVLSLTITYDTLISGYNTHQLKLYFNALCLIIFAESLRNQHSL